MKKYLVAAVIIIMAGIASLHYVNKINNIKLYEDVVCDDSATGDDDCPTSTYERTARASVIINQAAENNKQTILNPILTSKFIFELFGSLIGFLIIIAILVVIFG